jgi:hypothetical protein
MVSQKAQDNLESYVRRVLKLEDIFMEDGETHYR